MKLLYELSFEHLKFEIPQGLPRDNTFRVFKDEAVTGDSESHIIGDVGAEAGKPIDWLLNLRILRSFPMCDWDDPYDFLALCYDGLSL